MPPETIAGRYDVVREVGRGGMGAVYLCRDRTLDRDVAIKQVGGLPGESSPHLARALREARSSAALNHPNVVSIFDAIDEGSHVWLVMEYLPSRTLSELLRAEGPLDVRRAARLGAQVADGLAAAHQRGTVHRDVKPGNILVTDADVAKISDFGISRTLGEEQLTQTGMVSGTPLYFSPALARGSAPTPADDVWALGATLFSAVEGVPPWPHQENSIAMLMHIVNNLPAVPKRAGALAEPIRRMMNIDPDARPSMAEAAAMLHAIADGRPDAARALGGSGAETRPLAVDQPTTATPVPAPTPVPALAPTPTGGNGDGGNGSGGNGNGGNGGEGSGDGTGRSRRGLVALGVAAAVVVVALAAALLTGLIGGDDDPGTAAGPGGERSSAPADRESDAGATAPSEDTATTEPAETTETTEPEPTEDASTPAVSTAGDAAQFVEGYYDLLPEDTKSAWDLLSPAIQDQIGSYGDYRSFWNTVRSVRVDGVEESGGGTVQVQLTYDGENGVESETRQITVQDATIVADEVP